jgi:hypothetical protein
LVGTKICSKIFEDRSYSGSVQDNPVDGVVKRHHIKNVFASYVAGFDVRPGIGKYLYRGKMIVLHMQL